MGLRWLPPTTTVLYLPPNLIAAMVLGIVALGECLTDELLAGMAFVLMGIAVGSSAYANLRKARARLSGRKIEAAGCGGLKHALHPP